MCYVIDGFLFVVVSESVVLLNLGFLEVSIKFFLFGYVIIVIL